MSAGTVSRYLQKTAERGFGWPLPAELDDTALEARLFPRAAPVYDRVRPDCAYIHRELKRDGVTLQLLWEEYAQVHPNGYRHTQFCEIYRQWAKRLRPSMRQVHRAGEKTFIDFSGKRPTLVDRRTGELRPVELFVAVLGASSFTYAEATETQQLPHWVNAHVRMVDYFGGATTLWIPDNLKSAITRPCRYEPDVNRTYEDLATHYGAVVVPARPRKPRDKAAVENGVLLAQRWILARLRDQTFFELGPLNAAIRVLLDALNDRPMKKLGVSRRVLYEQLDRPALRSLPATRYVLAQWKLCSVNIDYHVALERHAYSVPYQLVREKVEVRYTTNTVEIFYKGKRLTSHRRRYDGQPSTVPEHMPSAHRAHAEWTPSRLIRWGEQVGPATGQLVARILQSRPHPEQGYRACLGIMRLGRQHGNTRLNAASTRAMALGSYRYPRRRARPQLHASTGRAPRPAGLDRFTAGVQGPLRRVGDVNPPVRVIEGLRRVNDRLVEPLQSDVETVQPRPRVRTRRPLAERRRNVGHAGVATGGDHATLRDCMETLGRESAALRKDTTAVADATAAVALAAARHGQARAALIEHTEALRGTAGSMSGRTRRRSASGATRCRTEWRAGDIRRDRCSRLPKVPKRRANVQGGGGDDRSVRAP